jgi:GNAT superfamily N-acetyltransferase
MNFSVPEKRSPRWYASGYDSAMQWQHEEFTVSDARERLDLDVIHEYLGRSYWAQNVPREIVARSIEHSLCFGVYVQGEDGASRQIGFARAITDRATMAYLADVFVLEPWRGRGVSKFLMRCIRSHPDLQGLRRWMLSTADAHGLYRQFDFLSLSDPARFMEIVDRDVYARLTRRG